MKHRAPWLWGFGGLTLLVVSLMIGRRLAPPEKDPRPSSYNASPQGTKALFLLLRQTGVPCARWQNHPSQLSEKGVGTLLMINEANDPRPPEHLAETLRWVTEGHRWIVVSPSAPTWLRPSMPWLTVPSKGRSLTPHPRLSLEHQGQAGSIRHGRGTVIVMLDAAGLTNEMLPHASSLSWFWQLAARGPLPLSFDETRHGFAERPPLPWHLPTGRLLLGHAAIAAACWLWWHARRLTPPRSVPSSPVQRIFLEHVEAVARFWYKVGLKP